MRVGEGTEGRDGPSSRELLTVLQGKERAETAGGGRPEVKRARQGSDRKRVGLGRAQGWSAGGLRGAGRPGRWAGRARVPAEDEDILVPRALMV